MVALVIETQGAGEIQAKLQALQLRMRNLRPVLLDIGDALVSSTSLRFSNGVDPDGAAWLVSLRAKKDAGQTLVHRARLRQSITRRATSTDVRVGTNVVYGPIHQFGGKVTRHAQSRQVFFKVDRWGHHGRGFAKRSKATVAKWATVGEHEVTMPKRPFLGLSSGDHRTIHDIIGHYLRSGL